VAYKKSRRQPPASRKLWKVVKDRVSANGGLKLPNDTTVSVKQLQAAMDAFLVKHVATNPHDWPMVNGNLPRNAQAKGSPPMLDYVL